MYPDNLVLSNKNKVYRSFIGGFDEKYELGKIYRKQIWIEILTVKVMEHRYIVTNCRFGDENIGNEPLPKYRELYYVGEIDVF